MQSPQIHMQQEKRKLSNDVKKVSNSILGNLIKAFLSEALFSKKK